VKLPRVCLTVGLTPYTTGMIIPCLNTQLSGGTLTFMECKLPKKKGVSNSSLNIWQNFGQENGTLHQETLLTPRALIIPYSSSYSTRSRI
jgi:hypothetical protein